MNKKIAIVTGAGSVINAWQPILGYLDGYLKDYIKTTITPDQANSFLARSIYLNRYYSNSNFPGNKERKIEVEKEIEIIKKGICESLSKGIVDNVLEPRKEFEAILVKYVFDKKHDSIHITTNWDTVIEDYINQIAYKSSKDGQNKIPALYIHGSIRDFKTIYLPSEIVNENYRAKEEVIYLHNQHNQAWRLIEESNELIIYGLSLDPLDAELIQILAAGISSKSLDKIYVINPSFELVCNRVKMLIDPRYPIELFGVNPSNLDKEIKF